MYMPSRTRSPIPAMDESRMAITVIVKDEGESDNVALEEVGKGGLGGMLPPVGTMIERISDVVVVVDCIVVVNVGIVDIFLQ